MITGQQALYRDPRTLTPYSSLAAYKTITKTIEQEFVWSDEIGAYTGQVGVGLQSEIEDIYTKRTIGIAPLKSSQRINRRINSNEVELGEPAMKKARLSNGQPWQALVQPQTVLQFPSSPAGSLNFGKSEEPEPAI